MLTRFQTHSTEEQRSRLQMTKPKMSETRLEPHTFGNLLQCAFTFSCIQGQEMMFYSLCKIQNAHSLDDLDSCTSTFIGPGTGKDVLSHLEALDFEISLILSCHLWKEGLLLLQDLQNSSF